MKSIPTNPLLYATVKKEADAKFDKPSAYKSAWIVREYKRRGGTYETPKPKKSNLTQAIKKLKK